MFVFSFFDKPLYGFFYLNLVEDEKVNERRSKYKFYHSQHKFF